MEVYTFVSAPFRIAGKWDIVKTEVDEYERVNIGKGYYAIVFNNPIKDLWHIALEDCGALIMTDNNKEGGIRKVKGDVETGDVAIMKKQIKKGKSDCRAATLITFDDFCGKFKS